jgi:hypothetical protein
VGLRLAVSVLAALVALALAASTPVHARAADGAARPGCDYSRPAVAHRAGGARLARQPARRPIPCLTRVGQTSEAATIGVTRSGAVFFAPLNRNIAPPPMNVLQGPELVVRSRDQGAIWTALNSGSPTTGGLVPPWMSVDPVTSRIWFVTTLPTLCGARISWSDDGGDRWRANPSVGCPGQGSERVLEGPAPRRGATPTGYPHVVYYCGNATDVMPSILWCYRSLNGGRTFTVLRAHPDPAGPPGACGVNHAARPGTVGPDGALYFPLDLCGDLGVAISRDEGATWHRRLVAHTNVRDLYITSLATDSSGNVYIAWVAGTGPASGGDGCCSLGGLPYLTVSRDHGRTWSKPIMIAAPGVRKVAHTAIAATGTGHIAVAYLGRADGGASYSGYITESRDALARRPVFLSAAVNDPARPLISAPRRETFGDRLFYISDAFGPDGVPWAGFQCAYESSARASASASRAGWRLPRRPAAGVRASSASTSTATAARASSRSTSSSTASDRGRGAGATSGPSRSRASRARRSR